MGTYGSGTYNGPDAPASADPQDLTTLSATVAALGAGGFTVSDAAAAQLPSLITAASQLICREARRYFVLTTYDEVLTPLAGQPDKGESDFVLSRFFPLQSVSRVATGRTTALTISNTQPSVNQDAFIQFTFTGDPEISVVRTGLTLTRFASGTQTDAVISWSVTSPFTTVQDVADQINALGGGWLAVVAPSMGGWAAAELYGPLTPLGVYDGPGVSLDLFATRLAADCEMRSGTVWLPRRTTAMGAQPGGWWCWPNSGEVQAAVAGWREPVRLTCTAGWAIVPLPIQQAVWELAQYTLQRRTADGTVKSESAKDYSYELQEAWHAMPPWVFQAVARYKAI